MNDPNVGIWISWRNFEGNYFEGRIIETDNGTAIIRGFRMVSCRTDGDGLWIPDEDERTYAINIEHLQLPGNIEIDPKYITSVEGGKNTWRFVHDPLYD